MATVVEISNFALDKLGHGPITSLSDNTTASDLCNRLWPLARDKVLRDHPWNFAIKRANTAPSGTAPDWGFTYQHPVPADFLRLLEVDGLRAGDYQLESDHILANDDVLYIRYVAQITDPAKYDPLAVDALATLMAFWMSEPLTQSNTKKGELWAEYGEVLKSAKRADAQENPPTILEDDDWLTARL